MADEVVVVGENRPSFESPAEIRSDLEQATMQHSKPRFPSEVMLAQVGAGGDEVCPANAETMLRRVRPRNFVSGHMLKLANLDCGGNSAERGRHRFRTHWTGRNISAPCPPESAVASRVAGSAGAVQDAVLFHPRAMGLATFSTAVATPPWRGPRRFYSPTHHQSGDTSKSSGSFSDTAFALKILATKKQHIIVALLIFMV
jgi:hypothetical protein